jgi:hypothetical protein
VRGKYYQRCQQGANVVLIDSDVAPQWQRDLLDERLASCESEEGRDWEDLKAEVWPSDR